MPVLKWPQAPILFINPPQEGVEHGQKVPEIKIKHHLLLIKRLQFEILFGRPEVSLHIRVL